MSYSAKPNIVVIGGSYVGLNFVDSIAPLVHKTHRTVLVEKNSHFEHLFAFPRASVISGFAHKAFIPYTNAFNAAPPGSISVVRGAADKIIHNEVILQSGEKIPYEYLVIATGTGLLPLSSRNKVDEVLAFEKLQERVKQSDNVVIIGGGASGLLEMATDAKESYPTKNITLIHSRDQLMNRFHPELHNVVMKRLAELGVDVVLGQRVKLPVSGHYEVSGPSYSVELANGGLIPADIASRRNYNTPS